MAGAPDVRLFGPGDNAFIWNSIASNDAFFRKIDPFFRRLILANLNSWPFTNGGQNSTVRSVEAAQALSIIQCLYAGKPINPTYYILASGEIIAPAVNLAYMFNTESSRREFVEVMKWAIGNLEGVMSQYFRETTIGRAGFLEDLTAYYNSLPADSELRGPVNQVLGAIPATERITPVRAQPPGDHTLSYYIHVLLYYTSIATNMCQINTLGLYVSTLVAFIKQGNMSPPFIRKIVDGVRSNFNRPIQIDEAVTRGIFSTYGYLLNADRMSQALDHWVQVLPTEAPRIRLLVLQQTCTGLPSLLTIRKAMQQCPDFPWEDLDHILPGELRAYALADIMVGNTFYNRDLDLVRATLYKNLGYVAKELCNRCLHVNSYGGWTIRNPKNRIALDNMISTYENAIKDTVGNAEAIAERIRTRVGGYVEDPGLAEQLRIIRLGQYDQARGPAPNQNQ